MTVNLSPLAGAGWQFFTDDGVPLSGGLLYTYAAGTTTPQTTYTSSAGTTANTNPIVLNSAGRVANQVWLTAGVNYKLVLQNSVATQIWSQDNVQTAADLSASSGSSFVGYLPAGTGAVATTVQTKLRESVSVLDFGAVSGGSVATNTAAFAAFAAYLKTSYLQGHIPAGSYTVTSLNFSAATPSGFNTGLYLYGDGSNSTFIHIVPGTNNVANTIGIDLSGAANVVMRDMSITGGSSETNCPNVTMLLAKTSSNGIVFSGNMVFENLVLNAYGSYGVYVLGAETLSFKDCGILGLSAQCANPFYISKVNTPGITSPNTTLNSPADSMTVISYTGAKSYVYSLGVRSVFFDVGTSQISTISFEDTYFPAYGSAATVFSDNGVTGTALLSGFSMRNIRLELSSTAGAGSTCNQVAALITSDCAGWDIHATWSSADMLAGIIQWEFTNLYASRFNIGGNISGSYTLPILKTNGSAAGSIFQVSAAGAVVSVASGQYLQTAMDVVTGSVNGLTFAAQNTHLFTTSVNGALSTIASYRTGGSQTSGTNSYGGIQRQTTAAVANSATTIYGPCTYGELLVVTGVGGGKIFADLLMVSYSTVATISSNTQTGSPAARTYSLSAGNLQLTMGDTQAMNITAQAFTAGAYGA